MALGEATPEERARKRVEEFVGLMWHVFAFVVVNGFLWGIDIVNGGGVDWAYWVTIAWGLGLVFHVADYLFDRSGFQERRYQRLLAEEREREARDQVEG